jgi:GTP cyclohydrolase IA
MSTRNRAVARAAGKESTGSGALIRPENRMTEPKLAPRSAQPTYLANRTAAEAGIVSQMTERFSDIITLLGEDVEREGLVKTPERAAKAMYFLTRGYRQNIDELINDAVFTSDTDEMVIVRNIELYSMCEHHMLPFIGKAHVAYLPNGKVLGLSKIARIVDFFARRLQIQEVLTKQIAECVQNAIGGKGVGVVVEAQHMCMMMRGVEKQNSVMTTSCMLGNFRSHPQTRNEFLRLLGN